MVFILRNIYTNINIKKIPLNLLGSFKKLKANISQNNS